MRRLLAVAQASPHPVRNAALLHCCLSGLRVGEPLMLTWGHVLDPGGRIATSAVLPGALTKDREYRRCYWTPAARAALGRWLEQVAEHGTVASERRVFALTRGYATQLVAALLRAAGLDASSHSLRRTCATELSRGGVAPRVIQETLGHASLATTQVYLETSPALVERAIGTLRW
ncbi:MAG: tyrosine-type recombinase/integrase [Myxococcota bacterium]